MKKIRTVLAVIGCMVCLFCTRQSTKDDTAPIAFSLSGMVTGFKDSTWFYIQNSRGTEVDSAIAIGGLFKFTRQLSDEGYPEMAIFVTRNFDQAVVLWLENKPMTITVEKGKFQNAIVTGSSTHSDWSDLNKVTTPIYRKRDSVSMLAENPKITVDRKKELAILKQQQIDAVKLAQIGFIQQHPGSILSASLLDGNCSVWGKKLTSDLFASLLPAVKDSRYGENITAFIALNKDLKVGDKFADLEQRDVSGVNQKLSNFKGKVILLEFWAGWCGPCRKENPELRKNYASFNKKGFEIYAVSLDFKREQWTKAIEADQLPWTQVSELNGFKNSAAQIYGVDAIPDNFLIDQNGIIVARNLRGEELTKKLKELLN